MTIEESMHFSPSAGVAPVSTAVGGLEIFSVDGRCLIKVFEIDVTNGHDHAGVFEADDAIRGSLFVYHISMFGNER